MLTELSLDTSLRADTESDGGADYRLAPAGGTLRLRETGARPDGGWRLRRGYSAQVCPEDRDASCVTLSGNLAFTAGDLPTAVTASPAAGG